LIGHLLDCKSDMPGQELKSASIYLDMKKTAALLLKGYRCGLLVLVNVWPAFADRHREKCNFGVV
jgi:hypothetical protein